MNARNHNRGFSLIELVVALTISAIVIGFATMFLTGPVDAYLAQSRRAQLLESSSALTRTMAQDLRQALPNSVRIRNAGTRAIVEMLVAERVFYFANGTLGSTARELQASIAGPPDTQFSTIGPFMPGVPRPFTLRSDYRLSVTNNLFPYTAANRALTPAGTSIRITSVGGEDSITLTPGYRFNNHSPTGRLFLVTPVTYICNSAANTRLVRRYSTYAVNANIPTTEAAAQLNATGVVNTIVARDAMTCAFRCDGGSTAPCQRTLTLDMNVARPVNGGTELTRVFAEFPLENQS